VVPRFRLAGRSLRQTPSSLIRRPRVPVWFAIPRTRQEGNRTQQAQSSWGAVRLLIARHRFWQRLFVREDDLVPKFPMG
jgi:hypothetical protein